MSIKDIIRAWKDSNYRDSLTDEQRALLPSNPIGEVLSQDELLAVSGGIRIPPQCATDPNDSNPCSCWPTDWWCD